MEVTMEQQIRRRMSSIVASLRDKLERDDMTQAESTGAARRFISAACSHSTCFVRRDLLRWLFFIMNKAGHPGFTPEEMAYIDTLTASYARDTLMVAVYFPLPGEE